MSIFTKNEPDNVQPTADSKKEKQKAADEARRAARKDAMDKLMAFVKEQTEKDPTLLTFELKSALFAMKPLRSATPTVRETIQDKLKRLFGDKKVVTGYEVYQFEGTHWGTSDMRRNMILAIKSGEPADRLWISYDAKNDNYMLEGTGADAPLGWCGYTPIDVAK